MTNFLADLILFLVPFTMGAFAYKFIHKHHITISIRHGQCGLVTASGDSLMDALSSLRCKINERGLVVDWSTIKDETI